MNDLSTFTARFKLDARKKVDEIAFQLRSDIAAKEHEQREIADRAAAEHIQQMQKLAVLEPILAHFRADLKGRVPVRVAAKFGTNTTNTGLEYFVVTLGGTLFFNKPLAQVHIKSYGDGYRLDWVRPNPPSEGYKIGTCATTDAVIENLTQAAAQFLVKPPVEETADWVHVVGAVIG